MVERGGAPLLQVLGKEKMRLATRFTALINYNQTSHFITQHALKLRKKKKKEENDPQ